MSKMTRVFCSATLLAGLCGAAMALPTTSATIGIDTWATGDTTQPNTALVATLSLQELSAGVIQFTLNNTIGVLSNDDDAFLSQLLFSFDGTPAITTANFSSFGGSQIVQSSDIKVGSTNNASFVFGIDFGFPVANGLSSDRFLDGENTIWQISAVGLTVDDFLKAVAGNNGNLAMVHIQGLATNAGSVKYVGNPDEGSTDPGGGELPEPGSLALVALGLVAAGWRYRKSS